MVDVITVLALYGMAEDHPQIHPEDYVTPLTAERAKVMDTGCLNEAALSIGTIPHDQLFTHDPRTTEPARSVAIANDPGHARSAAPILLVQGTADAVVVPARTEKLRGQLCALHRAGRGGDRPRRDPRQRDRHGQARRSVRGSRIGSPASPRRRPAPDEACIAMVWGRGRRLVVPVVIVLAMVGAACTSGDGGDATGTTRRSSTTTSVPVDLSAQVAGETVVSGAYRQGIARVDDGWIFSSNDALFHTDDAFVETAAVGPAITAEYAQRGFNHIGDIDVVDDVIYAPLEQPEYSLGTQVMARYDAETLKFKDAVDVAQQHNAWVTVDPDTGIAYSMDEFSGKALLRYDTRRAWRRLAPLAMSANVDRVQGGDVRDGAVWLSTDDATDGVYRVDLRTGRVLSLGSIGRVDGEGEGIDATPLPSGDLHVLSADVAIVPVRVIQLRLTCGSTRPKPK